MITPIQVALTVANFTLKSRCAQITKDIALSQRPGSKTRERKKINTFHANSTSLPIHSYTERFTRVQPSRIVVAPIYFIKLNPIESNSTLRTRRHIYPKRPHSHSLKFPDDVFHLGPGSLALADGAYINRGSPVYDSRVISLAPSAGVL